MENRNMIGAWDGLPSISIPQQGDHQFSQQQHQQYHQQHHHAAPGGYQPTWHQVPQAPPVNVQQQQPPSRPQSTIPIPAPNNPGQIPISIPSSSATSNAPDHLQQHSQQSQHPQQHQVQQQQPQAQQPQQLQQPPQRQSKKRKLADQRLQQQQQVATTSAASSDRLAGFLQTNLPSPAPSASVPTPPPPANQQPPQSTPTVASSKQTAPPQTPQNWSLPGPSGAARSGSSAMPQSPATASLAPPPEGIYKSFEDLLTAVQRVAKDQGYGVVKLRSSNYREGKPTRFDLVCDRGGVKYSSTAKKRNPSTRKVDCPWRGKAVCEVSLGNQWRFVVQEASHNHQARLPVAPPGQENTPVAQSIRSLTNKIDRMTHDMSQGFGRLESRLDNLEKRWDTFEQNQQNQQNQMQQSQIPQNHMAPNHMSQNHIGQSRVPNMMSGAASMMDGRLGQMEARMNSMEAMPMEDLETTRLLGNAM